MTTTDELMRLASAHASAHAEWVMSGSKAASQEDATYAALRTAIEEVTRMARRAEILTIERDLAQARFDRVVKILSEIHMILYPGQITAPDGRAFIFRPSEQTANEYMQLLSDRIRAIPDELDAIRNTAIRSGG